MKSKFTRIILIIIFTLIFSIALDRIVYHFFNKISDKVYSGQSIGKLNYFLSIKDSTSIFFLGSSRTSRHFNPDLIMNNSFNMGMDGTKIAYSTAILETLDKNQEQFILFHIDPEYAVDTSYTGADIKALSTKYKRILSIKENIDKLNQQNPFQYVYSSLAYNGMALGILYNYFKKYNEYDMTKGYQPNYIDSIQQRNFKLSVEKFLKQDIGCKENLMITNLYKDMILQIKDFSLRNNKQVIFITSPRYLDTCEEDNNLLSEFMSIHKLDYIDDTNFFTTQKDLYWKDIGHMSDYGATAYAPRIRQIIKQNLK